MISMPWSADYSFGAWHIRFPSEILTLLAGIALVYGLIRYPEWLQQLQGKRALFFLSVAWVVWLTVSLLLSSMPVESAKYWLVETGQWWVFFVGFCLFPGWWSRLLPLFILSMGGIVLFTLAHHSLYNFRADQSLLSPMPFFPDHTMYSAVLVMILPNLYIVFKRHTATILLFLLVMGLFFAHCRAAWMSIGAASLLVLYMMFQAWRSKIVLVAGVLFCLLFPLRHRLAEKIQNDVSMQERFNRYSCAVRMAKDRPLTGFGPGTFQFQYLPYQKPEEMTRISVVDPERDIPLGQYGRGGGTHSEYFQALAENGWPGLFLWVSLVLFTIFTGINAYTSSKSREDQWIILALTISLFTYFFHAFFNNFLHDGRIALLFWGQIGRSEK